MAGEADREADDPGDGVSYVTAGYLGWSNARSGLEFYVADEGNARWLPRARPGIVNDPKEKGRLLQDELEANGCYEGTCVVVLALPGRLPERTADHLARLLAAKADDLVMAAELEAGFETLGRKEGGA